MSDHADTRRADLERTFPANACERLIRANYDYYSTHGHYVPALAELLNVTRAERDGLRARVEQLEAEADLAFAEIQKARELLTSGNAKADGLLVKAQVRLVGEEVAIEAWNRRRTALSGLGDADDREGPCYCWMSANLCPIHGTQRGAG